MSPNETTLSPVVRSSPMDAPIVSRFRWTADELLQAQDWHFRHQCRPAFRFGYHCLFALMILAGCGLLRSSSSVGLGIGFILGGVYWFALRRMTRRWIVRRQFRSRPDRDVEIEWQITPDKIRTQHKFGGSEFDWDIFAKVVLTPDGVLFYPTNQIFHWLPRTGFADDSEFERCVELAKTKVERHYLCSERRAIR